MEIDEQQFQKEIESHPLIVVFFRAEWSEPCKQMAVVVKELEAMHSTVKFFSMDIEKSEKTADLYNVRVVPTILLFNEKKVLDRVEGASPVVLLNKVEALAAQNPPKTQETSLTERIEALIASADVMLFMKGSPEAPRCGFSSKVVEALNEIDVQYSHFDILQDDAIRQGLKEYSCWPTYPQLYAGKEFMGGCDIIMELKENGQLRSEIAGKVGESVFKESLDKKIERLINSAPNMLFMKGTPSAPRCKFSLKVVNLLKETGVSFNTFDILQDESIRQELKNYSQWPTYPQLYVNGEFIGGCDIIEELHSNGELRLKLNPSS